MTRIAARAAAQRTEDALDSSARRPRTPRRPKDRSRWWRRLRRNGTKASELGELELFRWCSGRDLRVLASVTDDINFTAGEVLCRQGRKAFECFVLTSGLVEVRVHDRPVAVLGPGDVVGETAVLDGGLRTATVIAATDVHAFVIDRRRIDALLERAPAVGRAMLTQLARRLRHVDSELVAARCTRPDTT